MRRNYSELIRDKGKRQLSAKGYKFIKRCIDIVAAQHGTSYHDPKMKPVREKIYSLVEHLIIDQGKNLDEIKEIIKNRTIKNGIN